MQPPSFQLLDDLPGYPSRFGAGELDAHRADGHEDEALRLEPGTSTKFVNKALIEQKTREDEEGGAGEPIAYGLAPGEPIIQIIIHLFK